MKKRFLTLALALVLCLGLMPHGLAVPALAAESDESQITWLPEGELPDSYNREFHYLTFGSSGNYTLINYKRAKLV